MTSIQTVSTITPVKPHTLSDPQNWIVKSTEPDPYCIDRSPEQSPQPSQQDFQKVKAIDPPGLSVTRGLGKHRKWIWKFTRMCQQAWESPFCISNKIHESSFDNE